MLFRQCGLDSLFVNVNNGQRKRCRCLPQFTIVASSLFTLRLVLRDVSTRCSFLNSNSGMLTSMSCIYGFVAFRVSKQNNYSPVVQTLSLSGYCSRNVLSNIKSDRVSKPPNRCFIVLLHHA